jgi:hypothetical protein
MRLTKKKALAALVATLVVGLAVILGVGFGIVKLWPVARTRTQTQLSRTGGGMAGLAALTGNPELAEVLKWTAAMPALGPLVQNGGYRMALEEAVRQKVPNIAQIKLDQVASPEVRALLAEVQQTVARNPQGAEAASTVNANVLNLLKSEAFARLSQNPGFFRFLSGAKTANESE